MPIENLNFLEKEDAGQDLIQATIGPVTKDTVDNLMKCLDYYCNLPAKNLLVTLLKWLRPYDRCYDFFVKLKKGGNKFENTEITIISKTLNDKFISDMRVGDIDMRVGDIEDIDMRVGDIEDLLRGRYDKHHRMEIVPPPSVNPYMG